MNDLQIALCYTMPLRLTAQRPIQRAEIHHSLRMGFPSKDSPAGLHNSATAICRQTMCRSRHNRWQPGHLLPAMRVASSRLLCTTEAVSNRTKKLAAAPTSPLIVLKSARISCQRTRLTQKFSTGATIHHKRDRPKNEAIQNIDSLIHPSQPIPKLAHRLFCSIGLHFRAHHKAGL